MHISIEWMTVTTDKTRKNKVVIKILTHLNSSQTKIFNIIFEKNKYYLTIEINEYFIMIIVHCIHIHLQ
jgi:phage-related protein